MKSICVHHFMWKPFLNVESTLIYFSKQVIIKESVEKTMLLKLIYNHLLTELIFFWLSGLSL